MRIHDWWWAGLLGTMLAGCAGMQSGISADTRASLAPTGKLRVAFLFAPIYATKDPATGELKGIAIDLGKELARRVGVPFEPVSIAAMPTLIAGATSGGWDVGLTGINAERAAVMDFSAPFMEVEQGYLDRAGVPIATAADIDKPGVRIAIVEKGGADLYLSGTLKSATLIRAASPAEVFAMFGAGKAEVIAATKSALFAEAGKRPGSRVLDGRLLVEPIGIGVPKGRAPGAAAFVGAFVEDAKTGGQVKVAIERAGLRGVVVAPLK